MRRRTWIPILAGIALVVLLIVAISLTKQHQIKLKEIPATAIPNTVVEWLLPTRFTGMTPKNIVWRVAVNQGDYQFVACTFSIYPLSEQKDAYYLGRFKDEGGQPTLINRWMLASGRLFDATSGKVDVNGASRLDAQGIALDTRIAKIVAKSSLGTTVETVPVNGFWWLELNAATPSESWSAVVAVDANGKELYRIDTPPLSVPIR